jgi:hypothetical protein
MTVKSIRWSVDIFRKRGHHLGTIEAPDERSAVVKAAGRLAFRRSCGSRLPLREWMSAPADRNKGGATTWLRPK